MKDMKVTFSDTTYDFAGWTTEKCGRVLAGLCGVIRDHRMLLMIIISKMRLTMRSNYLRYRMKI